MVSRADIIRCDKHISTYIDFISTFYKRPMGVTVEQWRAKIGSFLQPVKSKTRLDTLKCNVKSLTLAIRLLLFFLLVAEDTQPEWWDNECQLLKSYKFSMSRKYRFSNNNLDFIAYKRAKNRFKNIQLYAILNEVNSRSRSVRSS